MLSLFRNRLGVPGLLAVIALVFAMAGGAYAAKRVIITKLNQISPKVQKQLQDQRERQARTEPRVRTEPA
jgi:uncharacterized protein YneF (UPF0154 family)